VSAHTPAWELVFVEQNQAYHGEGVPSCLFHAFGTNLQFAPGELNFVKTQAECGTKAVFRLRGQHFDVPDPPKSGAP
jgi:enoyl-CoA hydratase